MELDSYAAMDTVAAAARMRERVGQLFGSSSKFGDYDWNTPWSNGLYKAVVDATIFDPRQ